MKKLNLFFALALVFIASQISFGQTIVGSAHDFSGSVWNPGGEICLVCHTPHTSYAAVTDAPLWNHQSTATVFTLYSSSTMTSTVGQPDGSSKLCLSCHDGTIALANFSGSTSGTSYISNFNKIGTSLANDHPISMTYDAALATADGGLYNPTTTLSGISGAGTITTDMTIGGKMQCSSCHDVHNGYGLPYLMKKDNAASALCLTCHNK